MKAELNNRNKAKFLGNHIGCIIEWYREDDNTWQKSILTPFDFGYFLTKKCRLLAKPLSQITDEDAIEVSLIHGGDKKSYTNDELIKGGKIILKSSFTPNGFSDSPMSFIIETIDYLRSKGYALPYMGLTVEQMVKAGWMQLNTNPSKL